ncbi:MAG TPA: hypothetical protein VE783_11085 [Candidatus Limnocylindrales bacterium]|nr:hypothetical protein [Candidatus Limnocylindrales bacterium]
MSSPWLPALNGVTVAAGLSIWAPLELHRFRSLAGILVWTCATILFVLAASAFTIWLASRFQPEHLRPEFSPAVWQASLVAVWMPPLILFFGENNTFMFLPALMLATGVARLGAGYQSEKQPSRSVAQRDMFGQLRHPRRSVWPFAAAACFHGAALAWTMGAKAETAGFTGATAGILVWWIYRGKAANQRRWSGITRCAATTCLAILVTMTGLMRYLASGAGFERDDLVGNFLLQILFPRHPILPRVAYAAPASDPSSLSHGGMFNGVVMTPRDEKVIMLAPPPLLRPEITVGSAKPLKLLFQGVYWFYKPPYDRPPQGSAKSKADPQLVGLRSSDDLPLVMEAHQLLSEAVRLNCCRAMSVTISNRDLYPGTVWLELILTDTHSKLAAPISLGTQPVQSRLEMKEGAPESVQETLNFPFPKNTAARQFDEITVRYRLSYMREHSSARIAIENFELLPGSPAGSDHLRGK